jgi:hypothetical protein
MRSEPQGAYIVWIFTCTLGLLQALASYHGWYGLSFFRRRPRLAYLFALATIPTAYYWFFAMKNRNVEGLEGWQLFSRFAIGVGMGLVATLLISSLLNNDLNPSPGVRRPRKMGDHTRGLDALSTYTFAYAATQAFMESGVGRVIRAAQRRSWGRVLSLLSHLSVGHHSPSPRR